MVRKIILIILFSLCVSSISFNRINKNIIITIENNNDSIIHQKKNDIFKFDKITHKDYTFLFDSILNPEMTKRWGKQWVKDRTWIKATKIRIWAREFLDKNGWVEKNAWQGEYKKELISINDILKNNQLGKDGLCSYYAYFYMHCCLVSGINNRRVGWWHPGGDQINEVYDPNFQKWVAVSPLYNCWFSLENMTPLSLLELNKLMHDNKLNLVVTQRDYQVSNPKPELYHKNWFLRYAWDICYWKKNGYLMLNNLTAIRYRNPNHWPYRFHKSKLIDEYTADEDDINFDVASIDVGAKINKKQLSIEIVDFEIINFKEFICQISDSTGKIISSKSFTSKSFTFEIETLTKGVYTASVYGKNTRNGETNKVQIFFKIS